MERLDRIVETGLTHFQQKGYRRTRIGEIATDAGVSAGSIYNYCTSKEALFDLCLNRAFGDEELPEDLPHDVLPDVSVIDRAWDRLLATTRFEIMQAVIEGRAAGVYRLDEIVAALYDWLTVTGRGVRLIERCARDWPELAHYYYATFRGRGLAGLTAVVEEEVKAECCAHVGPSDVTARIIVELCAYFAMHRRSDPDPLRGRDAEVRTAVLGFIARAHQVTDRDNAPLHPDHPA